MENMVSVFTFPIAVYCVKKEIIVYIVKSQQISSWKEKYFFVFYTKYQNKKEKPLTTVSLQCSMLEN